jgi:transcriptional regulator with XRE-family HTH domain
MVKVTASEIFHPQSMACVMSRVSNGRMSKRPISQKRQFQRTFIRQWREHRNLTLEQLAERVDMTASYLSMLERGQRGYTQDTLEALAHALQTDTASLLRRDPTGEGDDAIWSIWDQAKPGERRMIVDIAKTITKTGI